MAAKTEDKPQEDKVTAARNKNLDLAIQQIAKDFGEGAIMRLGDANTVDIEVIPTGNILIDRALGVGGVLAGGALATGLIATSKYDDAKKSCSPRCTDPELAGSHTFAVTSTVLTGGAVVGVGVGVVLLLFTRNDSDSLGRTAPRFDVALGPQTAAASAAWSF